MERQHRVILISGIISAVIGLVAGFIGGRFALPPTPTEAGAVMRAQLFQLVDQAGRQRGRLGVDEHGAARLALFGPDGSLPRVSLAATPQGGGGAGAGRRPTKECCGAQSRSGRPEH